MRPIQRLNRFIGSLLLAATLAACGGGGDEVATVSPPTVAVSEVPNEVARKRAEAATATEILVPSSAPGMAGAKVSIPAWAALSDAINVQIGFENDIPGPFLASAVVEQITQVSKVMVLKVTEGGPSNFNEPITITMPYDVAAADGLPPSILFWDPETSSYSPVSVIAVDPVAGTVTFRTSHFSRFVAVVLKKLKEKLNVDTGFRVGTNSILHQNFGSYEYGGHCAAFASLASFYYGMKKPLPLYSFAQQGDDEQPVDDEVTRSALAVTYALLMTKWNTVAKTIYATPDTLTGLLAIQAMKATGKPVHFVMGGDTAADGAHAVTLYGYDAESGAFQIYDSNFPKNVVTFPWSLTDGFGTYSRAEAYTPGMFKHIGFASDDTYGAPAQFRKIIADWESGKLKDAFATLQVTDQEGAVKPLSFGSAVTVQVKDEEKQSVSGKFNRPVGSTKPVFLHVWLNGEKMFKFGDEIAADGSFTVKFPDKLEAKTEVMLLVSENILDRSDGFSGFGKFTVQPEGKNFFKNFGFETGDLSSWTGETSLLPQGGGGAFTPTKLTVVDVGFDPIATDIPRTVFGKHAVRVNDSDPSYHQTFVSQKATVPLTGNAQLNFKWAAVLEDPQHDPIDQPYIEVSVRNLTKGTDLYRKRFYTNDPNFNGWKSYQDGAWKAIDWQSVIINGLAQYAGDEIELKIVGADCGQGGHGGYVYLDGEE